MDCFALLDDRNATAAQPTSRLYTGFVREHRCTDPATLDATWAAAESDLRAGLHAVVLADYEWGMKLLRAGHRTLPADDGASLRLLMFERLARLSKDDADAWLRWRDGGRATPAPAGVTGLRASVDRAAFHDAIGRIHEAIRAGETYQVNYTYRLDGRARGTPVALYRRLRARQPVPYGAFIALPPGSAVRHVLSCSPELFLRHDGGVLTARPMKGTAPRGGAPEGDSEMARWLADDEKNRAENLMIVDLLRNDLGRIARIGSVRVPDLFTIESHPTVFQMTSTVQARLAPELSFADLLRATFPCGSITGAPKHHTMELIAELESTPRGLYTGAIGWVDAPRDGARCGDFCLSVAIRTLLLGEAVDGLAPAQLGIGAGIVLDSEAESEFDECRLKARFLTEDTAAQLACAA
jgi:para-aminobenzoate synthetase/4-amino-4-deoxychorismate lyase